MSAEIVFVVVFLFVFIRLVKEQKEKILNKVGILTLNAIIGTELFTG